MLFNSFPFILLFVPVTLAGFFVLGRGSPRAAATWLALASLFFYGWWSVRYLPFLLASIAFNFLAGLGLSALRAKGRTRGLRLALAGAVAVDLGVLGYYKYAGFFVASLTGVTGLDWSIPTIVLPLGVSFFTFTQIAFLVDTARGEASEPSFIHFTLFVTYFPHLIAGPILHHRAMMPQLTDPTISKP